MQRVLWLLLAVAFTLFIFANSTLPASESGRFSEAVTALLLKLGEMTSISFDADLEHHLRKLAHFLEFAIQTWILCRTFAVFNTSQRTANGYILFLALLTAVLDEYIQLFAHGRGSSVSDVLLDFSGVLCMWLAYRIWQWATR